MSILHKFQIVPDTRKCCLPMSISKWEYEGKISCNGYRGMLNKCFKPFIGNFSVMIEQTIESIYIVKTFCSTSSDMHCMNSKNFTSINVL